MGTKKTNKRKASVFAASASSAAAAASRDRNTNKKNAAAGRKRISVERLKAPPSAKADLDDASSLSDNEPEPIIPTRKQQQRQPNSDTGNGTAGSTLPATLPATSVKRKRPLKQPTTSQHSNNDTNDKPIGKDDGEDEDDDDDELDQRWTEVLAPGHILAEEVKNYIAAAQTMPEEENTHLEAWVKNVQAELEQQNRVVLKNIRLVQGLREANRRRNKLQDQLLKQRKEIQALKQEADAYRSRVEQTNDSQSTIERANQFLLSLQQMKQPWKQTLLL